MKRIIIGTAGHIDHGKTALVRALTGIDTDRLKEEKKRGISIELGFAPLKLPGGQLAGIVDVPGHERFIRQMLAGAFGVDLVLLIIAADEGIMPQTREHLDIIRLLGITQGIVVITKKDLVDEEWLMLVEDDISEYLKDTEMRDWPIIAVSSTTKENIPELLETIDVKSGLVKEKPAVGQVRMPIDRVFTMTGFGTVVTGTLWSGKINLNDTLQILPEKTTARVRTLQVHNQKVETALAGQRVAVNLQGIELSEVKRGDVLVSTGFLEPSFRINTNLRLLASSPRPLKNWARIRFHLGTDESFGRVVLLDHEEMQPGVQGYAQIVLEKPVVCAKNDRFVVRFYSPVTTIGGGTIIDPHPPKQKRFNESVLQQITVQEEGSLDEIVLQELEKDPTHACSMEELTSAVHAPRESVGEVLEELVDRETIDHLKAENRDYYVSRIGLEKIEEKISKALVDYRVKYPLRRGYPREELRSRLFKEYSTKLFNGILELLEQRGAVAGTATHIRPAGDIPEIDEKVKETLLAVMDQLRKELFSPPGQKELQEEIIRHKQDPGEIMAFLEDEGTIIKIADGMYFAAEALDKARQMLADHFNSHPELGLAEARDIWGTSRKYALPLMEYFDRIKFTRRVGDNRVLIGK